MEYEHVVVTWCDAHAVTETWTPVEDLDKQECLVVSTGLWIKDGKSGHIVLAQSMILDEDTVDGVLAIPLGMVRVIHRVSCGEQISLP